MNLNQVTLPCHDYESSVSFYRRMGFRQIVASPPRYARFECASGATFSIESASQSVSSAAVVYFEVDDVAAEVQRLQSAGVHFDAADPALKPWRWIEAHLRDPAGNRLCIYHAGRDRRFPPWRIADPADQSSGSIPGPGGASGA